MKRAVAVRQLPWYDVQARLKAKNIRQEAIALAADVTQATVSKAIRGRGDMTEETRERIWAAIEKVLAS